MGALYMGNKVFLKPDPKVSFPVEQFIRLLHLCGLPQKDITFIYGGG